MVPSSLLALEMVSDVCGGFMSPSYSRTHQIYVAILLAD